MKILIVDDEPGTRLMVATAIERHGHSAVQAANGEEGWRVFEAERPQVVITDWAMPGLDGNRLVAKIRAAEGGYTYIMLLSGLADEAASRDAVRAGADDVLAKPPDPAELERGLIAAERLIDMHRQMREDARRDPVTGVGSRLRLEEDLAALCARVARYGHAYCVALVAVDPADDEMLRRVTAALASQIRSGDVLYRSGPAQFAVLLPEQGLDAANLAAGRLREAALRAGAATINVGVVTTGHEPETAAMLAAAEAALSGAAEAGGIVGDDRAGRPARCGCSVADDDPVSRLMLGAIVKREADFELIGEAEDATPGDRDGATAAARRRAARRRHARRRRRARRGGDPRGPARACGSWRSAPTTRRALSTT